MAGRRAFSADEVAITAMDRDVDDRRAADAAERVQQRLADHPDDDGGTTAFTHLTARTGYSLRDGMIRPGELVAAAAAAGMTHVAVTDRDGIYGAVRVAQAAAKANITPVLGADLALAVTDDPGWTSPRVGRARDGRPGPAVGSGWLEDDAARITLLSRGNAGHGDVCRAITAAHLGPDGLDRLTSGTSLDRETWREQVELADRSSPHLAFDDLATATARDDTWVLLGNDSPVGRLAAVGRLDAATDQLRRFLDVVGPDRLRVAVRNHRTPPGGRRHGQPVRLTADGAPAVGADGTIDEPGDDVRIRNLLEVSTRAGVTAVAVNDVRHLEPDDVHVADVLACVRQQVPLAGRHLGRTTAEGHFATGAEMARRFAERPDLVTNAHELAVTCEVDLALGEVQVPHLTGLSDEVAAGELHRRAWQGLADRYVRVTSRIRERLERELDMVDRLGLHDYFLTVSDIMAAVRDELGILAACRGSAAGSLICHALGISEVDPVGNDLAFERFMNPYRDELPDIDIDVESARREDVYDLVIARYGQHRAACVAMVETFQARMAIREVGKVLGLPPDEIGMVAKSITHARARQVRAVVDDLPELANSRINAGQLERLLAVVERLDGLPRHLALHPCGILLADDALLSHTSIERSARGFPMVAFDKDDVAALGWLKLDVLGVRMLSSMRHAMELVPTTRGHDLDVTQIPEGDGATFDLVRSAHTIGVFQIESPGQRELLGRLQPDRFGDLITEISLFRPGPVKADMVTPFVQRRHRTGHGRGAVSSADDAATDPDAVEEDWYPHPSLEPVLRETHGVVVYHEQVMGALCALTGCDMAYADLLRRRLSSDADTIRPWALARARSRGFSTEAAVAVWKQVASFASFGFCKAHAAAFAVPTYRSAWLKTHYLPEFMAGLLTHDPGMYPRRLILDECRQFGVAVLGLDVNRSLAHYTVEVVDRGQAEHLLGIYRRPGTTQQLPKGWTVRDGRPVPPGGFDGGDAGNGWRYGVRVALSAVRGISGDEVDSIVANRPYGSLVQLRARSSLSRPVAERLARAGALDHLAGLHRRDGATDRREIRLAVEELWADSRRPRPDESAQLPLDVGTPPPSMPVQTPAEQVRDELAVTGLDASRHVLSFYEPLLDALGVVDAADIATLPNQSQVRVAGVKVAVQSPGQRSGNRVLFLSLDDQTGSVQVTYFASALPDSAWTVLHAWLVVAEGRVSRRDAANRSDAGISWRARPFGGDRAPTAREPVADRGMGTRGRARGSGRG
ncbi:DNA polymerase III subunit alpha, partial [Salsipaludibacter albus]|uniref:DNA polymerase III subunit alpha n=1 Tax=Salsipaludibacter albus TaxID=2849650 RepID=UPI001EE42E11